jgi:hypothetical protein
MTLHTASGPIPTHQYCQLQPNSIGEHGWIPVAWFGLSSYPGRTWGCHVMLECGAIYRSVPLHQLAHNLSDTPWLPSQAQTWDCYGLGFSTLEYPFLAGRRVKARLRDRSEHDGKYICTIVPVGDPWSAHPDQGKEFTLIALDNGRYTAQPTDRVLFEDLSFTREIGWPNWLRRQTQIWTAETLPRKEAPHA